MTSFTKLIDDLGGVSAVADILPDNIGYRTVAGWKARNSIPPHAWCDLIALATARGITNDKGAALSTDDLAAWARDARAVAAD